jgi:3-dehydroquinate synthase
MSGLDRLDARVLPVRGASPYDVVVGTALFPHLARLVEGIQRVAVIHAAALDDQVRPILDALGATHDVLAIPLPDGEGAKTAAVAAECWEALGRAGFTRSDAVVTFGGGATTDLAGFVAATWLRGVKVFHVPTTLLAMVDAAVGGKTGINTGAGKNLVGAFHEPSGVLCDLALLRSLPHAELVAGMGEVVKCGFIADPEILRLVEADPQAALDVEGPVLRELIERAIQVKIDVVVPDLKENIAADGSADSWPGREVLNYGHTMAHAIERASSYSVRHGEAVAIGCCYVAEVARGAGLIDDALAERHRAAFRAVGLPTTWHGATYDELEAAMRVDKKSRGSQLRFVVLHELAQPRILAGPDEALLRSAYSVMTGASR